MSKPEMRHDSTATIRATRILNDDSDDDGFQLPVATKENEWLGFCPSAVKLQNGDRRGSLKKRTDYGAAFAASGVTTYYCSQKGCMYMGHVSIDFVWKAVMKDERLGLKLRWAFLAKSHVFQGKVTGRQYQFQCPICIYSQGHAEGRTWKGVEIYIDHVSSHRGRQLSEEVLGKLNIINDRIAEDKEDFDLNFFPTALTRQNTSNTTTDLNSSSSSVSLARTNTRNSIVDSLWNRKSSSANTEVGPALSRTATWRSDRADSVVSGALIEEDDDEPWAEGLSEFRADKEEDYLSPDF
ncbi:hypothetical protein BDY17DRAFT_301080 [Neohortaea acidophila]|uniref:Uncharacterized protein n=1 Tax=Neohortaea acidophila TaxID=245834 RepID=A0A6A6PNN9_9PEZI|nr:uncharacterized protein BDY17DRAFT_301080 [Neohortaea acidophila]KAF2481311.1 hypothetical protein BDY17DRAFT_301080 [Neohortaea acidophila]